MQVLKELVQIIHRVKLRSIRKLGFPFETDNRLGDMYEMLANGATEAEIAQAITGSPVLTGDYRRLKSELTNRMVAALFVVDLSLPGYNDRQDAYYELHKNWAAVKILLGKNAKMAVIEMGERTYRKCIAFEFNELAWEISRSLRLMLATTVGNRKKYKVYEEASRTLQERVLAESLAEELYADFIINYVRQGAKHEAVVEAAATAYQRLSPSLAQHDSYTLHLYARLLQMNSYTAVSDYGSALQVCDEMIRHFERKPYTASVPLQIAYYQKLVCHFQTKRYDEIETFVARGLALLQEGHYNWFKYQEVYLLISLHTGDYGAAYRTYTEATSHSRFASQPADVAEYWLILGTYLHCLKDMGLLPDAAQDKRFSQFRAGRFLNETPIFSQDKRGVNVSILLLQVLFLVSKQDFGAVYEKMEAVEQYARRHLYNKGSLRSFYFTKALLELSRGGFHRIAVERKAAKYLDKMHTHPLEDVGSSNFVSEIIPYEVLWAQILAHLPGKIQKKAN